MTVGSILVIGSINYDYLLIQDRLPRRGETFPASSMEGAFGGKGANQAIQAARLDADVQFLGAVGDDDTGRRSLANFEAHGITATVDRSPIGTGAAVVHITGAGEVYATIYDGANRAVDADFIAQNEALVAGAAIVILQNEIPSEANSAAITLAHGAGVPVIYNAAPAREVDPAVSRLCTWFVVNEDEAEFYLGRPLGDPTDIDSMKTAATELLPFGRGVILTLGSRGSVIAGEDDSTFIPAVPAEAVDTTGAGDSFVGAFAVGLLSGREPIDAATTAASVASLTVMGVGAQSSMPTRKDLPDEAVLASSSDSREDRGQ